MTFTNFLNSFRVRIRYFLLSLLDDKQYAESEYRRLFGKDLDWAYPRRYSEKLQILKIQPKNRSYARFADKFEVRSFVAERIGGKYLNELYGVWDDPDKINFDTLPDRFVLKGTHGSGMNIICTNKGIIKPAAIRLRLRKWMKQNLYRKKRELQYADIKPRIICEKFLSDDSDGLRDFKCLCFKGEPQIIQVDEGRFGLHGRNLYTAEWEKLPYKLSGKEPISHDIVKPAVLEEMLQAACALSRDFPFVRVDFYIISNKVVFGELTFHPRSGFSDFSSIEFSEKIASYIQL